MTDSTVIAQSSDAKLLREKLAPQTSIRFFLILIAVSALAMLVFRSAADGNSWARVAALVISTAVGCFITFAGLFLIANLFSVTTAPIAQALESASDRRSTTARKPLDSADTSDREKP